MSSSACVAAVCVTRPCVVYSSCTFSSVHLGVFYLLFHMHVLPACEWVPLGGGGAPAKAVQALCALAWPELLLVICSPVVMELCFE